MKILSSSVLLASLSISLMFSATAVADNRERTVCGAIKERLYFSIWSSQAPSRNVARVTSHPLVEEASFITGDGKTMRGYRYLAHNDKQQPIDATGYVLVAMGNAMVSDQLVTTLEPYARAGLNAYVFDYRGYADSDGRRRIQAIIKDYEELVESLGQRYAQGLLYGTSLGGLVMLNAIRDDVPFTRAVIDASPSRLSDFGCPEHIDPVRHITADNAERVLVIIGARDRVLNDSMTAPLHQRAEEVGAHTYHGANFDHPFMDTMAIHIQRQHLVKEFLLHGKLTDGVK